MAACREKFGEQRANSRYYLAVTLTVNRNPYAKQLFETSSALLRLPFAISRMQARTQM
jgi:hypothetical protein